MSLRKITALALAGLLGASIAVSVIAQEVLVDPAIATMTPEQLVDTREATMRQNGGILRDVSAMSAADASAAASTMIQNFTNLPALFAEGSIVGDSRALPLIWEEMEALDAIFASAKAKSMEMKAAVDGGDTAGIGAKAQEIGAFCGQCHGMYRAS